MKKKRSKVGENKSETIKNIPMACADERKAVEFMEKQRWGDKPTCPHCESEKVKQVMNKEGTERNKRFLWRCHDCKKQFTVRIGTVFEESRIPLKHWCLAFWRASSSKKGVSALQISRETGLSYKSALFMMHRIRFAMTPDTPEKLEGDVEVDETYVGGKPRFKGQSKRGRGTKKTPVVGLVQRNGDVRARVITDVTGKTLKQAIKDYVSEESRIITDEHLGYKGIGKHFKKGHHSVNHGRKEYVRGDIYTNTIESFFAIVKRGLIGTYHNVSKKHLHRYIGQFEFMYNTRKTDDGERLSYAIRSANGKRLMYKEPQLQFRL